MVATTGQGTRAVGASRMLSPDLPRPPRGMLAISWPALAAASDPGQSWLLRATAPSPLYKPGCPGRLSPSSYRAKEPREVGVLGKGAHVGKTGWRRVPGP